MLVLGVNEFLHVRFKSGVSVTYSPPLLNISPTGFQRQIFSGAFLPGAGLLGWGVGLRTLTLVGESLQLLSNLWVTHLRGLGLVYTLGPPLLLILWCFLFMSC